ncbi:hypothetical protein NZK27_12010 [Synechococcus sp. FGCU-3]|nr:hypothetical protein [Synechococcus sp. FGCU3]
MDVTISSISMSAEEAFDLLRERDQDLWEQVVDVLADLSQEHFEAKNHGADGDKAIYLESGILFEGANIVFRTDS